MKTLILAGVAAISLAGAFVWFTRSPSSEPEQPAEMPQDEPRAGMVFSPRYPDKSAPERQPELPPGYKQSFPMPKLTRPMTNDGLRHGGVLYIGPATFHPPKRGGIPGMHGYVKIPPGYKMVRTNDGDGYNVDILVVPKTPEDYAARAAESERIALKNQQGQEHFRKEVRAEMEKGGSTPEEIDAWLARYEHEMGIINRLGTDNYAKARRAVTQAELKKLTPEQYEEWLKTLPPERVSRE